MNSKKIPIEWQNTIEEALKEYILKRKDMLLNAYGAKTMITAKRMLAREIWRRLQVGDYDHIQ